MPLLCDLRPLSMILERPLTGEPYKSTSLCAPQAREFSSEPIVCFALLVGAREGGKSA